MRTRNKPWAEDMLVNDTKVVMNPESKKGKWKQHFNNDNPIHIEVGCGKGRFIRETAKINPNINYIAIEKNKSVIVTGVINAKDVECSLVFVPGLVQNLTSYFDKGEINRIYINFCDPWENRKKWHKRRLTHHNFLNMYESLFENVGEVFLKTDNKELFEFSLNEFLNSNWCLKNISLDLLKSGADNIMTEYEQKFCDKGMPIYRCEAKK
jgi:tRNA (guanine-N7-)-methyltransferase